MFPVSRVHGAHCAGVRWRAGQAALMCPRPDTAVHTSSRAKRRLGHEPWAKTHEPRATSHDQEPRVESHEPRATSHEPRATSQEPRATSQEPRAKSQEPQVKSQEPRATSQEPRAMSSWCLWTPSWTPSLRSSVLTPSTKHPLIFRGTFLHRFAY